MGTALRARAAGAVRIGAGSLKGRAIAVPKSARPSEARVRGALFSIWAERIHDARFLDLFAGSGAVGIEALSRGALEAVFVESDRAAVEVLRRNLALVPRTAARLHPRDVDAAIAEMSGRDDRFDLIFLDPPYAGEVSESTLTSLAGIASEDAELAVEHSRRNPPPAEARGWIRRDLRRYGDTALSIYGRTGL
ncbi:MAG TPA: 16S rRNA (guanine(966)-N(2))-methyltransferase RsmD [Thermoanaerobaculia bacterium]